MRRWAEWQPCQQCRQPHEHCWCMASSSFSWRWWAPFRTALQAARILRSSSNMGEVLALSACTKVPRLPSSWCAGSTGPAQATAHAPQGQVLLIVGATVALQRSASTSSRVDALTPGKSAALPWGSCAATGRSPALLGMQAPRPGLAVSDAGCKRMALAAGLKAGGGASQGAPNPFALAGKLGEGQAWACGGPGLHSYAPAAPPKSCAH